ncbi:type II toxin-antitoxin system VapC family toxin [Prosthecobacter sp.]|uniref:type II toxin-antitoxin system VapC family toxin n=1 Tax=Prosthecobacter sp. TaxID=1965333 RepID=UPI001DDF778A|nr:type II toxin-antitoxin system VapC family toxin [Prosthecobacter sp.]MCB1278153.1 type II toxin-antitoxin system VapC family toxin [Prosthecobacter sp.]
MRLLDSNIVIYATLPANGWLRAEVLSQPFAISQATRVEVLGWHRITPEDKRDLESFLAAGTLLSITDAVADRAIELRQAGKMSLGDAFIAATALEHDLELLTRNTDDYKRITALKWSNPFDQAPVQSP